MADQPLDLTTLYEDHARRVWRTLVRLGVPSAGVEDAVQEVFLTAHRRLDTFGVRSGPATWLIGIAVKVAANTRRRSTSRATVELGDSLPALGANVEEELERRRRLHELEAVLSQLPDEQREAVVLCDLEQLSAPEVSEALSVNVNTVYSRLRLGRAALARALKGAREEAS